MIILICVYCGSSDLSPTYNTHFQCCNCERELGFWEVSFAKTKLYPEIHAKVEEKREEVMM